MLFSVGHSNRSWEDFLALLTQNDITALADVRAFPTSRRWPHFRREALEGSLAEAGIRYIWIPALGGRRAGPKGSVSKHTAWTVDAFRNYADYADSAAFDEGLSQLLEIARHASTAFMCAEALYWQCHRRLIADHLVVRGHEVMHISGRGRVEPHRLPAFARVVDGKLIYDGGVQLELTRER